MAHAVLRDVAVQRFLPLWLCQAASLFGTQLTGFAVGVSLHEQTGSRALFGVAAALTLGPQMVLGPVAGVWVDRVGPRRSLVLSHTGAGLCSALLAILHAWGGASAPVSLALVAFASACNAPQAPAFAAATRQLVAEASLGRSAALNRLGGALARLGAPFAAVAWLPSGGLSGVLAVDSASVLPVLMLLGTWGARHLPYHARHARRASVTAELGEVLGALRSRPQLQVLLGAIILCHLLVGALQALVCPTVLEVHDAQTLSQLVAVAGAGLAAGAGIMAAWGGPRRPLHAVLRLTGTQGLWIAIGATQQQLGAVLLGAFGAMTFVPLVVASAQAAWQRALPPSLQGRAEGVRVLVTRGSLPLAVLLFAPLADLTIPAELAAAGTLPLWLRDPRSQGSTVVLIALGLSVSALSFWLLRRVAPHLESPLPSCPQPLAVPAKGPA